MKPLAALARGWRALENLTLSALVLFLVGVSTLQILLRNAFDSGLLWADPALRLSVLWIALVGAMIGARERRHIAMDLLQQHLNAPWGERVAALAALATAAICALTAWHGARMVALEWQDGGRAFLQLPLWACELIIPLALAVIALRYLISFIDCLRGRPCMSPR